MRLSIETIGLFIVMSLICLGIKEAAELFAKYIFDLTCN